ncbi:MAG: hypothetical protein J1E42_08750 [Akkermansiaceae bacterium]|nr:hypothetical protein [Akkermansiaceae bacterium]
MGIQLEETELIDEWLAYFTVSPCREAGECSAVISCREEHYHCSFRYNAERGFSKEYPAFLDMLVNRVITSHHMLDSRFFLTPGFVRTELAQALKDIATGALRFKRAVRYALFRVEIASGVQRICLSALRDVFDADKPHIVKLDNTRKSFTIADVHFEEDVAADGETRYAFRPCYIIRPADGELQLIFDENTGIALIPHLQAEADSDEAYIEYYNREDAPNPSRYYYINRADSLCDLIAAAWAETGQPAGFIPFALRARLSLLSCICRILAQIRFQPDGESALLATLYVRSNGEFSIRGNRQLFDLPFWDGGSFKLTFSDPTPTLPPCRYLPRNFATAF